MSMIFPRSESISGIPRMNYFRNGVTLEKVAVHEVYNENLGFSRLYTDKNELLVLVTNGYGAPWSTLSNSPINLLMDARIVQFFYDTYIARLFDEQRSCWMCGIICECKVDEAPMQTFLAGLGFQNIYLRGLSNLAIETVPAGKKFRVTEYDGCESVVIYTEDRWISS